jgi:Ser/Thr protein kinase RdoA (MazF antagonist)
MTRGGANFTSDELALVLSHYQLGTIYSATALLGGNSRAPKRIIVSEKGKFLLKRRPHGKDDIYRVVFAHGILSHLNKGGFPVASLVPTEKEKNTVLNLNNHIYELFEYIPGKRYDNSNESAYNAGKSLVDFHKCINDFPTQFNPLKETYHDSTAVRGHLKLVSKKAMPGNGVHLSSLAEQLTTTYNQASTNVNQLSYDAWPEQIIHGDWHPGNMLFENSQVVAVLDFDSIKVAPTMCDLANGMLHFSIVGGRPNPADWPDYLNMEKLKIFLNGYRSEAFLNDDMLNSLPDLMIETMIAEAVLPVAATGFFGNLSGDDFLGMILRKCLWILNNKAEILKKIFE